MLPGMIAVCFMLFSVRSHALEHTAERRAEMMRRNLPTPSMNAAVMPKPRGVEMPGGVEWSAASGGSAVDADASAASALNPPQGHLEAKDDTVDPKDDLEDENQKLLEELDKLKKLAAAENSGANANPENRAANAKAAENQAPAQIAAADVAMVNDAAAKPQLPSDHESDTHLEGQVAASGGVHVADGAVPSSPRRDIDQHLQGHVSDTGSVQVSNAGAIASRQRDGDKHYQGQVSDTGSVHVATVDAKPDDRESSGAHVQPKAASSAGTKPSSAGLDVEADRWKGQVRADNRDVQAARNQQQQQQQLGSATAAKYAAIPGGTTLNDVVATTSQSTQNQLSSATCAQGQWVLSCAEANGQQVRGAYISQSGTTCNIISDGVAVTALAQCSPSYKSTPITTANIFAGPYTSSLLTTPAGTWSTSCPRGLFPTTCLCSGQNCGSNYWIPDANGLCTQTGANNAVMAICAQKITDPQLSVWVDTTGASALKGTSSVTCPAGTFVQSCSVLNNAPNSGVYIDSTGLICTALFPADANSNAALSYTKIYAQALCGTAQTTRALKSSETPWTSQASITCSAPMFALECSCSIVSSSYTTGTASIVCPDSNQGANYYDPRFRPNADGQCTLPNLSANGAQGPAGVKYKVNAICGKASSLQLETGSATIRTTSASFSFRTSFAQVPVVIITPSSEGLGAQATVQISSVTSSGFTAQVVGSGMSGRGTVGPVSMTVSYLAVFGSGRLGRAAQGPLVTSGRLTTTRIIRTSNCAQTSDSSWDPILFANSYATYVNRPALLTQLQTFNNPSGNYVGPWGVAVTSLTANGASVALELGTSSASVSTADTIGWIAIEAVGGSFVDNNRNNMFVTGYPSYGVNTYATAYVSSPTIATSVDVSQTVGYPVIDGQEFFPTSQPTVLNLLSWTVFASKTTRGDTNGGFLRLCTGTSSIVKLVTDKADSSVCLAGTDTASIVAFSGATRVG